MTVDAGRIEAARAAARDALRESALALRASARERDTSRRDLERVVAAAVDGVEALAETLAAHAGELPAAAAETLRIALASAWEQLATAGVRLDGEPGEPVDLGRHRVVKRLDPAGGSDVVAQVLSRGIVFDGARLRAAAVVVRRGDGAHRD